MIDDLQQTGLLMESLKEILPFETLVSAGLARTIQKEQPSFRAWQRCQVQELHYLGDEGGITCHVVVPGGGDRILLASITNLVVDPAMPLAREVAAYQKRRIKRLRRSWRTAA